MRRENAVLTKLDGSARRRRSTNVQGAAAVGRESDEVVVVWMWGVSLQSRDPARHVRSKRKGSLMTGDSSPHLERRPSSFHKFGLRLRAKRLGGAIATHDSHSMTSVGSQRVVPIWPAMRTTTVGMQSLIRVPECWIRSGAARNLHSCRTMNSVRVRVLLHRSRV